MTLRQIRLAAALPALALLAACGGDATPASDAGEGAAAEGEVLGGTISDEMIPYDSLKSTSPPKAPEPGEAGATGTPATPASETAPAAEASDAEAPAETDSPAEEG